MAEFSVKERDAIENCIRDHDVFKKKVLYQIMGTLDEIISDFPEDRKSQVEALIKRPLKKSLSRLNHVPQRLNKMLTGSNKNNTEVNNHGSS